MKPLGIKNYGSIPHLFGSKLGATDRYVNEGQNNICTKKTRDKNDAVIVLEKYDATNVGIANVDGKIVALTRSGYLAETSPYKQHHYFASWVEKRKWHFLDILQPGERLAGEWMMQTHGIPYQIDSEDDLCVFFDMFTADNVRLPFFNWSVAISGFGLSVARVVFSEYHAIPVDFAYSLLLSKHKRQKTSSKHPLCKRKPEGLVYRVEKDGEVLFLAKWVRPDFTPGKYLPGVGMPDDARPIWNYLPELLTNG